MVARKNPKKRGPKPETLVIEGDWKAAMKQALAKGKPPAPPEKPRKSETLTAKKKRRSK